MPHDRNGNELNVGDTVLLVGTVKEITSTAPTYCNVLFEAQERMADDAPPYAIHLSARMLDKPENVPAPEDAAPCP